MIIPAVLQEVGGWAELDAFCRPAGLLDGGGWRSGQLQGVPVCLQKATRRDFFFFNLIYIHAHVCVCGCMCIYRNRLVFALYLWQELTILFLLLFFFFKLCL